MLVEIEILVLELVVRLVLWLVLDVETLTLVDSETLVLVLCVILVDWLVELVEIDVDWLMVVDVDCEVD